MFFSYEAFDLVLVVEVNYAFHQGYFAGDGVVNMLLGAVFGLELENLSLSSCR